MTTRTKRFLAGALLAVAAVAALTSSRTHARTSRCTAESYDRCNNMISVAQSTGDPNALNTAMTYCRSAGCLEN